MLTRETIPAGRSGVILGNTLTGEWTRSQTLRLRWPYVRKALRASAEAKGLPSQTIEELIETMEVYYKSVFAPITEDSLAGGLSNTIAGRICNFLDLHGGGYTVDGACSSSLIAIATAATALNNGDLDLALAGGVDVSLDTFELIGFAKTEALTPDDMRVYDRKASGFIPGEGCGFIILRQVVISGERSAVEDAMKLAQSEGIQTKLLQVSNAFHSRFVRNVAEQLLKGPPIPEVLKDLKMKLFSCMASMDEKEVKPGINLHKHFSDQVMNKVDFVSLIETMSKECDLMLEVGTGRVLCGLVNAINGEGGLPCLPVESKPGRDKDLNTLLPINMGSVRMP